MQKLTISKCVTIFLCSLFFFQSCQKPTIKKGSPASISSSDNLSVTEFERSVYQLAQASGDFTTAINSIHRILVLDSTQTSFYDTLARMYLGSGNARSAAYYAEKSLSLDPGNEDILELAGYIYFEGGSFRKAEEKFTKLYQITKEPKYLYQLSQIYGYLDEKKRANEILDMILNRNDLDEYTIDLSTSTGGVQLVKIKAACWFIRANFQNSPKQALPFIKKALQVQPSFEIARKMKDEFEIQVQREELEAVNRRLNQR